MQNRVTNKMLESACNELNRLMKRPINSYVDGKPQKGNIHIDYTSYGGHMLVEMGESGGISAVNHDHSRCTKKEIYSRINYMIWAAMQMGGL